jgi:hypothetical protein
LETITMTATIPFGRESSGDMLSDHIGYAITFGLAPRPFEMAVPGALVAVPEW